MAIGVLVYSTKPSSLIKGLPSLSNSGNLPRSSVSLNVLSIIADDSPRVAPLSLKKSCNFGSSRATSLSRSRNTLLDTSALPFTLRPSPTGMFSIRAMSARPLWFSPNLALIAVSLALLSVLTTALGVCALTRLEPPLTRAGAYQVNGSEATSPAKPKTPLSNGSISSGRKSCVRTSSSPIQPRLTPVKNPSSGVRSTPPSARNTFPPSSLSLSPTFSACAGRSIMAR